MAGIASASAATICNVLFFVTSSDSDSMVIDIIASGSNTNPSVQTRSFGSITEGFVAATLLFASGLRALQAASIPAALRLKTCCWWPFCVVATTVGTRIRS